jgi:hypothetical protein
MRSVQTSGLNIVTVDIDVVKDIIFDYITDENKYKGFDIHGNLLPYNEQCELFIDKTVLIDNLELDLPLPTSATNEEYVSSVLKEELRHTILDTGQSLEEQTGKTVLDMTATSDRGVIYQTRYSVIIQNMADNERL